MNRFVKRLVPVGMLLASTAPLAPIASVGAATGAWTGGPVTIRVELDLPESNSDGPRVQQVTGVTPGDQVELTSADEIENPSDWCGTLWVDIDPDAHTVQVSTGQVWEGDGDAVAPTSPVTGLQPGYEWDDCDFETATVTITGAGFETLTLVSDDLWESDVLEETVIDAPIAAAPLPNTLQLVDVSVFAGGEGSIVWQSDPSDDAFDMKEGGAALFGYTVSEPTPTTQAPATTVAPTTTVPPIAQPAAPVVVTPTYTG
jgi:hypothetical protein